MGEAFRFHEDNILTKDHFEAVRKARVGESGVRFGVRLAEQDAKFDKRFAELTTKFDEQNARFKPRFARLERASFLHTWMLGIMVVVLVIPQLQAWLV